MNKLSKQYDLTIVVNTCDKYYDVLEIFFLAFHDNWQNCPYPVIINSETNKYKYNALVHNYISSNGNDDWGARLIATLNSINSEYVLMLYDDFILDSPINNNRINEALELLKNNKKSVVTYLLNTSIPLKFSNSKENFIELKDRVENRLNSYPAIWRKENLIKYTAPGDTPWAWEAFGTYRTWGDGNIFYSLNPNKEDIFHYNHSKGGAIYRGKWVRTVVDHVSIKYPLEIDWNIRGFSSDINFEKRSFIWKLRFLQTGFRMVGFKSLRAIISYLKVKIYGL
jgi:hypothetical protein